MRVWLVTGAARGFGKELVRQALAEGDAVVATARDPRRFDFGSHERLLTLAQDVTDEQRAAEVADAALARFGRIDVLVSNAGSGLLGAVEETTLAQARAVFETNVFGLLAVTRAVLRGQRSGHLVALSSMGGFASGAGFGVYAASKFAVEGLHEALAEELAPFGVRVTIVEPGGFATGFGHGSARTEPIADYALPRYDGPIDGHDPVWGVARIRDRRCGCRSVRTRSAGSAPNSPRFARNSTPCQAHVTNRSQFLPRPEMGLKTRRVR